MSDKLWVAKQTNTPYYSHVTCMTGKDTKNLNAAADHGPLANQITSRTIKQLERQAVINSSLPRLTIKVIYPV